MSQVEPIFSSTEPKASNFISHELHRSHFAYCLWFLAAAFRNCQVVYLRIPNGQT